MQNDKIKKKLIKNQEKKLDFQKKHLAKKIKVK